MPGAKALQEQLDKQALTEVVLTYFRACDRRDFDLLRSCYHEDAVEDRGAMFQGGLDDWIAWVKVNNPVYELTVHRLFNAFFKVDSDCAEGEIYAEAYHRTPPPDSREIIGGGRYLDRYERRDGVWKIVRRASTADRSEIRNVDPESHARLASSPMSAVGGPTDPSYRELRLFGRAAP